LKGRASRPRSWQAAQVSDDIVVWGLTQAWGLSDVSPFVSKLELWLQLVGLPYEKRYVTGPLRSRTRKIPFVDLDGGQRRLEDSGHIIATLGRERGVDLDRELDGHARARHLLVRRLIETHLYFVMLHQRWQDPAGFELSRKAYFERLPAPLRGLAAFIARRGALRNLHGQGLGRRELHEVQQEGLEDLETLAGFLGDAPFFGGNEVATVDATCAAFLLHLLDAPYPGPLQDRLRREPALLDYLARVTARASLGGGGASALNT